MKGQKEENLQINVNPKNTQEEAEKKVKENDSNPRPRPRPPGRGRRTTEDRQDGAVQVSKEKNDQPILLRARHQRVRALHGGATL